MLVVFVCTWFPIHKTRSIKQAVLEFYVEEFDLRAQSYDPPTPLKSDRMKSNVPLLPTITLATEWEQVPATGCLNLVEKLHGSLQIAPLLHIQQSYTGVLFTCPHTFGHVI